jgi:hypothetical protein
MQKSAGGLDKDKEKNKEKSGDINKDLFEIKCVVTNEGFLPTALKMADRVKIVRPDWVEVKLPEGAELEKGFKPKIEIGHLKSGEKKEVRWRFKLDTGTPGKTEGKEKLKNAAQDSNTETTAAEPAASKAAPLEAEVSFFSTRGGVDKKKVQITIQ